MLDAMRSPIIERCLQAECCIYQRSANKAFSTIMPLMA